MKPATERFKAGDIVRYASGVSALFRYEGTHNAGRLYGTHVMGGVHSACDMNFFPLQAASIEDIEFCKGRHPDWFEPPAPPENEPAAWIAFADNGNIRFWTADPERAKAEKERGLDLRMFTIAELIALLTNGRRTAIEECATAIGNMRQSEAGLFDAKHSGQRGCDRSDALHDAYQTLRGLLA